jgi:predicted nuclease with TOPRIM domain
MTKYEEIERAEADLNEYEGEIDAIEREMSDIERENPDYFEDENWNGLSHDLNELHNEISYLITFLENQ